MLYYGIDKFFKRPTYYISIAQTIASYKHSPTHLFQFVNLIILNRCTCDVISCNMFTTIYLRIFFKDRKGFKLKMLIYDKFSLTEYEITDLYVRNST